MIVTSCYFDAGSGDTSGGSIAAVAAATVAAAAAGGMCSSMLLLFCFDCMELLTSHVFMGVVILVRLSFLIAPSVKLDLRILFKLDVVIEYLEFASVCFK